MVKSQVTGYGVGQSQIFLAPKPLTFNRQPSSSDVNYDIGQQLIFNGAIYELADVTAGVANWVLLGSGGVGAINSLTGDTGGAITPVAGNIDILGIDTVTVAGTGGTLTIEPTASGYPNTPYVVGPAGQAGYQTIQSAVTDLIIAGGDGLIFVQGGAYTENLNLTGAGNIGIQGSDEGTTIIGQHIPNATGNLTFDNLVLESATDILNSAAAGSTVINFNNCFFIVTNGYVMNLANWTGELLMDNCGQASTDDGVINNTGGSTVKLINVDVGAGTGNTMNITSSNFLRIDTCNINCPISMSGTGSLIIQNGCKFNENLTIGGSLSGYIVQSVFSTGATQSLTYNSSGNTFLTDVSFNSSNNPAIGGNGAGTLTFSDINFVNNSALAGTLTVAYGSSKQGSTTVTGNLSLTTAGNKLSIATGANASVGTATLAGGTVTVNTTAVTASSVILLTRQSIGATGAAATGNLTVGTVVAGTSFVINAVQSADATALQASDVSVIGWMIIN